MLRYVTLLFIATATCRADIQLRIEAVGPGFPSESPSTLVGSQDVRLPRGMPLTVRITLENTSQTEVAHGPNIKEPCAGVFVRVRKLGDGAKTITTAKWEQFCGVPAVREFQPGEISRSETFVLGTLAKSREGGRRSHVPVFIEAGQYELWISSEIDRVKGGLVVESNRLLVNVVEPSSVQSSLDANDWVNLVEYLRAGVVAESDQQEIAAIVSTLDAAAATAAEHQVGELERLADWVRRRQTAALVVPSDPTALLPNINEDPPQAAPDEDD